MAAASIESIIGSLRVSAQKSLVGGGSGAGIKIGIPTGSDVLPEVTTLLDDVEKMRAHGAALAMRLCKEAAQAAIARLESVRSDQRYYGVGAMIDALSGDPFMIVNDSTLGHWRYGLGKIDPRAPFGVGSAPAHPIAAFLSAYYSTHPHVGPRNGMRRPLVKSPTVKTERPLNRREMTMQREARNRLALFASAHRLSQIPQGPKGRAARRAERHIQLILITPIPAKDIEKILSAVGRPNLAVSAPLVARKTREGAKGKTYTRVVRSKMTAPQRALERALRGMQAERGAEYMAEPVRRARKVPASPEYAKRLISDRRSNVSRSLGKKATVVKDSMEIRPHGLYATVRHLSNQQVAEIARALPVAEDYKIYGGTRSYRFRLNMRGLYNQDVKHEVQRAMAIKPYTDGGRVHGRSSLPRLRLADRRPLTRGDSVRGQHDAHQVAVYANQQKSRRINREARLTGLGRVPLAVTRKLRVSQMNPERGARMFPHATLMDRRMTRPYYTALTDRQAQRGPRRPKAVQQSRSVSARPLALIIERMKSPDTGMRNAAKTPVLRTQQHAARALLLPMAHLERRNPVLLERLHQNLATGLIGNDASVLQALYKQYGLPKSDPARSISMGTKLTKEQAGSVQRAVNIITKTLAKEKL